MFRLINSCLIINVKIIENNLVGIVKDKNKYVPIIEGNKN